MKRSNKDWLILFLLATAIAVGTVQIVFELYPPAPNKLVVGGCK